MEVVGQGRFNLPNADLPLEGELAGLFLSKGLQDYHQALQFLKELPYGTNESEGARAVFQDGCGMCSSKHGCAAALAIECGLKTVSKVLVYYRLDASRFKNVEPVLELYGLPYVPNFHCVLASGYSIVDLTEGNKTGKLRDVDEFDVMFRSEPFVAQDTYRDYFEQAIDIFKTSDSRLREYSASDLLAIRAECQEAHDNAGESEQTGIDCHCS